MKNILQNKKLLIIVAAFVVLVGLVAGLWLGLGSKDAAPASTEASESGSDSSKFTVTVVHADKSETTFVYTFVEGKLGAFLEADGLIESEGADDGMFHTVDGEKADWNENQSYWAFYINGEYATTGIYTTDIVGGAAYKLEYTIG